MKEKSETHILKMDCGVTCTMQVHETSGLFNCEWDPGPPFSAQLLDEIEKSYLPWRDAIMDAWAKRTGLKTMIVTPQGKGKSPLVKVFSGEK